MNTPTHLLVAAVAFARPGRSVVDRRVNAAALFGALLPDLSLYLLVFWARFGLGLDFGTIFGELYFSESWQTVFAIDNSAPLYAALLALGLWLKRPWLWALAGAALLHVALDLPLHHDDGRAHFWPFTDWIFASPVSYWDPNAYGGIVAPLEILLALTLCVLLWRAFQGRGARIVIGLTAALQIAAASIWMALTLA